MPRCWRPLCSPPAPPAAAGAALNRARRMARRWCSISRPTRSTRGSTPRRQQGFYRDAGVDLTIREPGESTDAPKLLEAGRADFAILDIHDLGIAREHGLDLVGVMPIVQRPLASVHRPRGPTACAARANSRATPWASPACPPTKPSSTRRSAPTAATRPRCDRVTIGFNAVSSLAAGKVDAATGFWNAEGVALREQGVPIRVFKVERIRGAALSGAGADGLAQDDRRRPRPGRRGGRGDDPRLPLRGRASRARLSTTWSRRSPASTAPNRRRSCGCFCPDLRPAPFDRRCCANGRHWDLEHGLLARPLAIDEAFVERVRLTPAGHSAEGVRRGQPDSSPSRPSTSAGSSRAILERGTTRSTPAASAARFVSTSTWE